VRKLKNGISKCKALLRERNFLTRKIIRAKNSLCQGDQNVSLEIKELENALSSLVIREVGRCKESLRGKMEGEKLTRFFFRLEQKRAEKNSFESLFDENGFEQSSSSDIESILVNFYRDLYSKDVLDMQVQTELIGDVQFSLTDLESDKCEDLFTNNELLTALKGLQTVLMVSLSSFILPSGMT